MQACKAGLHRKVGPGRCRACASDRQRRYLQTPKGMAKMRRQNLTARAKERKLAWYHEHKDYWSEYRARAIESGQALSWKAFSQGKGGSTYWRRMMEVSE